MIYYSDINFVCCKNNTFSIMEFYNSDKYKKADLLFSKFVQSCSRTKIQKKEFGDFKISTITCVSTIAEKVNVKRLCQFLNPDEDIVYIESENLVKGVKKDKKKTAKKRSNRNQLFSNQMSVGLVCHNPNHVHNNPISVKIFKNGRIQMTGCKNEKEIRIMYEQLHRKICEIPTCFTMPDGESTVNVSPIQGIMPFSEEKTTIEMINGTFYINAVVDLENLVNIVERKYSHNEIFIIKNRKSPINFSMKMFGYFDEAKRKNKIPSVFVYNTGSVNIIATDHDILLRTYEFIREFLDKRFYEVCEKKIIYNDTYFEKLESLEDVPYEKLAHMNF